MNWYFYKIEDRPKSTREMIADYSAKLIDGLGEFIQNFNPTDDVQPAEHYAEWPSSWEAGFPFVPIENGLPTFTYRFSTSSGWYQNGRFIKLGPVPYTITIERADWAVYAHEIGAERPIPTKRYFAGGQRAAE